MIKDRKITCFVMSYIPTLEESSYGLFLLSETGSVREAQFGLALLILLHLQEYVCPCNLLKLTTILICSSVGLSISSCYTTSLQNVSLFPPAPAISHFTSDSEFF